MITSSRSSTAPSLAPLGAASAPALRTGIGRKEQKTKYPPVIPANQHPPGPLAPSEYNRIAQLSTADRLKQVALEENQFKSRLHGDTHHFRRFCITQLKEVHRPVVQTIRDMEATTVHKTSRVSIDIPLFQPFPSQIIFQNWKPLETYSVPLVLRNEDSVSRSSLIALPLLRILLRPLIFPLPFSC